MTAEPDRVLGAVLPQALEVMTAFTQSRGDPAFYWDAIARVLADAESADDNATPVARLTFGLSALAGILLDDLSAASGQEPAQILADVHRRYLAA